MYSNQLKSMNALGIIKVVLTKWYWLLIAALVGLVAGHVYLLFVPKLYTTSALLKFDDKKSEISELINVRNIYEKTNKVESEKSIIRSRTVIGEALRSLNYDVSFYSITGLQRHDTYPFKPFKITTSEKSRVREYDQFVIKEIDKNNYQLCYTYRNERICDVYNYGQVVSLNGLKLSIIRTNHKLTTPVNYTFRFNDQSQLVDRINRSLKLDASQNISLLTLHFTDYNPCFASDMLNAILTEYLAFDRMQRSAAVSQTSSFINSLLKTMADTVDKSGQAVQQFKQDHQSLITTDNLGRMNSLLSNLQGEKHTLDINHLLTKTLEKFLNSSIANQSTYNLQGVTDLQLNSVLNVLNDKITSRKNALYTYTENSEVIKRLDREILDLRIAIKGNLSAQHEYNTNKGSFIRKQIDSLNANLSMVPKAEKVLIRLQAKSDVNQKVYSYLAEKKLEAEIAKAAVTSAAIIIDKATYPDEAVWPIPSSVYIYSSFLGIVAATVIIYLVVIFNPFVYDTSAIEQLSNLPIIGIIRKCEIEPSKRHHAITENPRSLFAESIRSVRSNLGFFAAERNSKIICLTSEIPGEGKSFVSTNLAISLTLTEKKVLLIAGDLRKSKLHENFNISNSTGLSKYLSGQACQDEIQLPTDMKFLTVIPSGPVPPNPSELMHSGRMLELICNLKDDYDFVILDSAPIGLVTDAKPLMKMADLTLFILRSGISKRHFATTPDHLKAELGLHEVAIILNDFQDNSFYKSYHPTNQFNKGQGKYYHPKQGNYNYQNYFEI